jgi:O-antigen ligase
MIPTTTSLDNFFGVLALSPIPLSIAFSAQVSQLGRERIVTLVSNLAFGGTVVALLVTGYDHFIRGVVRAGELTMNPIHIGDIASMLGYVSLIGFIRAPSWRTAFLLLGPVLGLVAVLWTGSRGPLLAHIGLLLITDAFLLFAALPRFWRNVSIGFLTAGSAISLSASSMAAWLMSLLTTGSVSTTISPGSNPLEAIDGSTLERMVMYEGAWKAFLQSPLYGHGGANFTAAASAQMNYNIVWDHLHSDLADFAAIGGILGLTVYGLLLAAPLLAGWKARSRPALYLGLVVSAGYFGMGLTNAVLGILTLTVLFGALLALMIALAGYDAESRQ